MMNPDSRDSVPDFGALPSHSWIVSLRAQLRQLAEERKNPPPELQLSAERDPAALQSLVDTPSPFSSLFGQIRTLVDEILHPKEKFQASAEPLEVAEFWSAHSLQKPGTISMAVARSSTARSQAPA